MPEVEIYHSYSADKPLETSSFKNSGKGKKAMAKIFAKLAKITLLLGVFIFLFSFAPSFWYNLKSGGTGKVSRLLFGSFNKDSVVSKKVEPIYQPKYDPKLSREGRIKIPFLRIDTQIREATADNFEEALKKGVWRVSDFGTPAERSKPTILVAHRYGYLAWSIPYRLKNSFFSLPKLKVGETVEIIWKQRKYIYEVYGEDKGDQISDYTADLILYTCESLESPVRIFKYARLLQI